MKRLPPAARLALALALALFLCGGGGGCEREVDDAVWRFEWSVGGRTVADEWTDKGSTCSASARSDENMLSLLRKSKLTACAAECKPKPTKDDRLACRLACDKEIKIAAKTCSQKTRKLPPPPLFPVR